MVTTATTYNTPTALQNTASTVQAAKTDSEKNSSDFDSFLLLMTTQMKNQDPLKPIDSTQFVSQLAQFSGVEQQIKMNTKLENLISSANNSGFNDAALYLGKTVTAATGHFKVQEGEVSDISYKTPLSATSLQANIFDKSGAIVTSFELPTSVEGTNFKWDMMDNAGHKVSDGIYTIKLQAEDDTGTFVPVEALTKSKVIEVSRTDTGYNVKTDTGDILSPDAIITLSNT